MSTLFIQAPEAIIVTGIGTSELQVTVSNFTTISGVTITQTMIGGVSDYVPMTLSPRTEREEQVLAKVASVSGDNVTLDILRAVNPVSPYNVGGGVARQHNVNDTAVISNNPALFNRLTAKDNPEVVTEQWSFPTPLNASSPATKQYADSLSVAGAPEASDVTKGISKLSASPNVTIGVATVTIATPAVVSFTAHGLIVGDSIQFTTTGALPTGLSPSTTYFVISAGFGVNSFRVALTPAGSAINTTGSQSGIHTLIRVTPIAIGFNDTTKLLTTGEKAALAGGGAFGVPSASNKFITQQALSDTATAPQVITFTASGTWTKDAGLKYIVVEAAGGGGGGRYDNSGVGGGGGGGGGYVKKLILASALASTETITIGAGGAGGTSGSQNGLNGAATTMGVLLSAGGGVGATSGTGGAGGTATGGDLNINGQSGTNNLNDANQGSSLFFGGLGGASYLSLPALAAQHRAAVGYGFGGYGGSVEDGADGGAGAAGIVIVTEYYS